MDGVPSLDHGWVDVCPNQGNKGKSISIVGSDKISSALKTLHSRDLVFNNVFRCCEDVAGYLEDALNLGKDGANDTVAANSTTKDGKDSSTNTTPLQVVKDSQEVVGDDVSIDFVATQILVTTKTKNQFQEEPVLQTSPTSPTSRVRVSTTSPHSPTRNGGNFQQV